MKLFLGDRVALHHGDSRDVLKALPDNSVDSVVTDPPYALVSIGKRYGSPTAKPTTADVYARAAAGFMGQSWDTGETAFAVEFWHEVMRVLKPGGHVVAASGTRTYHRLAVAIEDAGFEIRDSILYLYGSGFPKSHNIGNGLGTALKPACEPWCLARKPLGKGLTVASNVLAYGTGAINVDGCRVGDGVLRSTGTANRERSDGWGMEGGMIGGSPLGRWPANVIHDGSAEVVAGFPETTASPSGMITQGGQTFGNGGPRGGTAFQGHGDTGSAARFFYTAKANDEDRLGSRHPTVKPLDLMQYLCRLITPPGGLVLDPFAGTGTTGEAAWREGFSAILIEREAEYVADIERRLRLADRPTERRSHAQKGPRGHEDLPLFGAEA